MRLYERVEKSRIIREGIDCYRALDGAPQYNARIADKPALREEQAGLKRLVRSHE